MADNDQTAVAPEDVQYPPYVVTDENRRRWDACIELADAMFQGLDPGQQREQAWSAARVFYFSDAPTGDESEREPAA